jgi:type IV pilus assembly protein PilX
MLKLKTDLLSQENAKPANWIAMGREQHGVVLIIAMIMLIVISLLAITSMRNSASTEALAGNVRTTELATQAAEIALRHCESSVIELTTVAAGGTTTGYVTTMTAANILPSSTPASWQNTATWDSATTMTFVIPSAVMGGSTTYKRPPECMVETLPVMAAGSTVLNSTSSFVITARGFGPEVAADATRARPTGSEVWLQSHIELQ